MSQRKEFIEMESKSLEIIEREDSTSIIEKDEDAVQKNKSLNDETPEIDRTNLKETGNNIEAEPQTLIESKEGIQVIAIDLLNSENLTLSKDDNSFMETNDSNENSEDVECSNQSNVEVTTSAISDKDIGSSSEVVLNEGIIHTFNYYGIAV